MPVNRPVRERRHPLRRRSRRVGSTVCFVLAVAGAHVSLAAGLPPRPLVIVRFQPPYADPISLHAVSCPSPSLCVAVDHAGDVLIADGANADRWRVSNVDGVANFTAVSCASPALCAATDQYGDVAISTAPAAGARAWHVTQADSASFTGGDVTSTYPTSISCPSVDLCIAVDNSNHVVASVTPAAHHPHWTTTAIAGARVFSSISCPSPSLCIAVDLSGHIARSTNPTGGSAAWHVEPMSPEVLTARFPASLSANFLSAVSCASETLCVATDRGGDIFASTQPGAGAATWTRASVDPRGGLDAVSCIAAPHSCTAVDTDGDAVSSSDPTAGAGAWRLTAIAPRRLPLSGVSCVTSGRCAAVAFSGEALTGASNGRWRVFPDADDPSSPRCFGATEPALGGRCGGSPAGTDVTPSPDEAQITPNASCNVISGPAPEVCAFGVPAASARATIALLGDSHAQSWRAALEVVAQADAWQGVSVTRSGCPFYAGPLSIGGPGAAACRRLMLGEVVGWLRSQPQISTVFVAESVQSVPHATHADFGRAVAGYLRAWRALPASVHHVIVIRDTPITREDALSCVESALAAHHSARTACALSRATALAPDPAAAAASVERDRRVQVVDLTSYTCDQSLCYPVVGGALVYKDFQHLTEVFSTTIGPYLGRDIARLMSAWRH